VFERRLPVCHLRHGLLEALEEQLTKGHAGSLRGALRVARRSLESAPVATAPSRSLIPSKIAPRTVDGFGFRLESRLRQVAPTMAEDREEARIERADLHSLLLPGTLSVRSRAHRVVVGEVPVVLVLEQLLVLAEEVLEAWHLARPLFRRTAQGPVRFGIRRGPGDGPLAFTVTSPRIGGERSSKTFPEITPPTFVRATTSLARDFCESVIRHDPRQRHNLRLGSLLAATKRLVARLDAALAQDAVTNPEPDSYRSFAPRPRRVEAQGCWEHGGKMRFLPRWVATVPNIDLKGSFLCGDRMVIGADRETACVHARSGQVIWRKPTQRAASVVTPSGLARIHPDGRTSLHDLESGQVRFTTRVEPRAGGGATGAVVHAPGLPKVLVLAEGDRRITALDLASGDVRWRYTSPRPAAYRFRRAGKLLLVAGGDSALVALDVVTGEVVWRVRGRLPFSGELCIDHDSAFALSGVRGGPSRLMHLDPWTGKVLWTTELEDRHVPGQAPLLTPQAVVVPSRDRRGVGARAFDRETGAELWSHEPGLASPTTAWLAIDDAIVANSAAGALLALDASTGRVRFHHLFSRHVDADQPRRLEPILRSGALFVPQHQVHVVRPRDGEVIGVLPSDLIPDLLRVDEQCSVYVAEESGHVAAFHTAPKLTLV
jgi:outer membrane protein assembly factor BamB